MVLQETDIQQNQQRLLSAHEEPGLLFCATLKHLDQYQSCNIKQVHYAAGVLSLGKS